MCTSNFNTALSFELPSKICVGMLLQRQSFKILQYTVNEDESRL